MINSTNDSENKKYYFLLNIKLNSILTENDKKLKKDSIQSPITYWLETQKKAPIFYGDSRISELEVKGNKQVQAFIEIGKKQENIYIVTIDEEYVWVYQPKGKIEEEENIGETYQNVRVKYIPIYLKAKEPIKKSPLTIASMRCNAHLRNNTFVNLNKLAEQNKLQYEGNIYGIQSLLEENKSINIRQDFPILYTLSSLEFETLVAKIFEERGFWVSAYKGGFLKDIDLIIENLSGKIIQVKDKEIPPSKRISIQIKMHLQKQEIKKTNDYYISLDKQILNDKHLNREWLMKEIKQAPITRQWLETSLSWVGNIETLLTR